MFVDTKNQNDLIDVANQLQVPTKWLDDLIQYESKHNPKAKNSEEGQSAKGLIQFIDSTAKWLGYKNSQDLIDTHPDYSSQIKGPVLKYLKKYSPYKDNVEFYNAVFRPADRFTPNRVFSKKIQSVNSPYGIPIQTPLHYTAYVEGKLKEFDRGEVTAKDLYEKNPYDSSAPKKVLENSDNNNSQANKKKLFIIAGLTTAVVALYYQNKRTRSKK